MLLKATINNTRFIDSVKNNNPYYNSQTSTKQSCLL